MATTLDRLQWANPQAHILDLTLHKATNRPDKEECLGAREAMAAVTRALRDGVDLQALEDTLQMLPLPKATVATRGDWFAIALTT